MNSRVFKKNPHENAGKLLAEAFQHGQGLYHSTEAVRSGRSNSGLYIIRIPDVYIKFETRCGNLESLYNELKRLSTQYEAFPRVPRLLLSREHEGETMSMMESLPGDTYADFLSDVLHTNMERLHAITRALAQSTLLFNTLDVPNHEMRFHGDFHASNVLIDVTEKSSPRIGFIDYCAMSRGPASGIAGEWRDLFRLHLYESSALTQICRIMSEEYGEQGLKMALESTEFFRVLFALAVFVHTARGTPHIKGSRKDAITKGLEDLESYAQMKLMDFIKRLFRELDESVVEYINASPPKIDRWVASVQDRVLLTDVEDLIEGIRRTDIRTLNETAYREFQSKWRQIGALTYGSINQWKRDLLGVVQEMNPYIVFDVCDFNVDNL